MRNPRFDAGNRCGRALACCCALGLAVAFGGAHAQSLSAKAKESGCVDKPVVVEGSTFKCTTGSGVAAYFNVPGLEGSAPARTSTSSSGGSRSTPTPAGFPKVDAETQRGRDDMRRKVLSDELAAEEKLLAEARTSYANGAPVPLAEEQSNAAKYQERIGRLRQAVQLHERNVEALRKELGTTR